MATSKIYNRFGQTYSESISGEINVPAHTNISYVSVPKGVYAVSFSPGYVLTAGTLAISERGKSGILCGTGAGWGPSFSGIVRMDTDGDIVLSALSAFKTQSNHSPFVVTRIG